MKRMNAAGFAATLKIVCGRGVRPRFSDNESGGDAASTINSSASMRA